METVTDGWPEMTEDQRNMVCKYQKLTTDQIDKFWLEMTEDQRNMVCSYQKLTTDQIDKFWLEMTEPQRNMVCEYQKLTTGQIDKFWPGMTEDQRDTVCSYQKLITDQIDKFWLGMTEYQRDAVCSYQKLTTGQINKFWPGMTEPQKNIIITVQKAMPTGEESIERAKAYAEKHNLRIDDKFLYAYRNHDMHGRGTYNRTIFYESGKSYHDFHCDPRPEVECSFGLGIWPEGNTKVKIPLNKFVTEVDKGKGKARVIEIIII